MTIKHVGISTIVNICKENISKECIKAITLLTSKMTGCGHLLVPDQNGAPDDVV